MRLTPGIKLGPYEIVAPLGAGGMGEVYRARDTRLDRTVAVKVLSAHLSGKPEVRERFEREARAISALNHPNICQLYDIGSQDGVDFLVMEYVDGETLAERLRRGALPLNQVLKYGAEAADALERAHRSGIIHRDLKPANIMLAETGAKLMDFGLAKSMVEAEGAAPAESTATIAAPITSPGAVVGTINYMSPEQARGDTIDARSDLFSAGAVLYEMTVGRPPFPGRTSAVVFDAILNREPPPPRHLNPDLPEDLGKIIAKCLEKDPEVRYQNAADLRADLKRLKRDTDSDDQSRRSSPVSNPPPASSVASSSVMAAASRHKVGVTLGSITLLFLFLAAGFGIYQWIHRPHRVPFQEIEITRITNTADVSAMSLSPDGKYVAYLRRDEDGRRGLWIRHLPTNGNVQILPSDNSRYDDITFGPDNNYVYMRKMVDASRGRHDLLRLPVLGGSLVPVVHNIDSAPSFSTDGKTAVFQRNNSPERGSTEFYSLTLATSEEKRLCTYKDPGYSNPALAPDGKHLAVIEPLKTEPATALALLDLSTCMVDHFFRFDPSTILEPRLAHWMPDGSGLVLAYRVIYQNHYQIGYLSYPRREFHKITNDLNDYLRIAISGDGKSLAALLDQEDDTIAVFPAGSHMRDADQTTVIPGLTFSWLGTDRMLVVENATARDLKIVNLATKEKSVLFTSPTLLPLDARPCTPDTVVFAGYSKEERAQSIYRIDSRGGNLRRLTFGKGDERAACSADAKWVIYYDYSDFCIRKVPLEGGTPQVLVPASLKPNDNFAMARDRNEILVKLDAADSQLAFVSIETGKITSQIPVGNLSPVCAVGLTPDEKGVGVFPCRKTTADLWIMPLDGKQPYQLTHHTPSKIVEDIWMFRWSPDAKQLALSRRTFKRDVVILADIGKQ